MGNIESAFCCAKDDKLVSSTVEYANAPVPYYESKKVES